LIAVGKTHPIEVLMHAYEAGHRDFGENRAAELAAKAPAMPSDIRWHFVGPLQRNKVRLVRPVVRLLHSMDRPALGAAWLKGPGIAPPALLEVNLADEPQKAGVSVGEAPAMAGELLGLGVDLRGLMAIPPQVAEPEMSRPFFRRLARLRDELASSYPEMRELSMGMTDDFEVAIEEGATMIRVGRAIFGPRVQH
jgi:pyridoxal phosphate enzyme (YggS family)